MARKPTSRLRAAFYRLSLTVAAAAIFMLASPAATEPAQAQTERQVLIETFARLSESVGALYALEEDGDLAFLCSATAVDREGEATVILTAYHCVRKGVSYLINFGDNRFHSLRVWQIPHYELDKVKYPRAYNEPKTDMALFLMEGANLPTIQMAEGSALTPGAKLAMVGFPLGLAKVRYEGIVSGHLDRPGSDDFNYLLLQIFGAPGSSGSAVVSVDSGKIIGVLVSGKQGRAGLPVIFATPIDYRRYLMPVPSGTSAPKKNAEAERDNP